MDVTSPLTAPSRQGPAAAGRPATHDRQGWAWAAGLGLVTFALSVLRVRNHWAGALDLGLFDQGMWLLSRGRAPELTIIDDNLFGDHLSVVMVLFTPLYRLAATPLWLVGAQALAIGATVVPMRRLARDLGAPTWAATVAVVGSAPLLAAALFDFHPVVLATPFVAWAIGAALRDDRRSCTIAALAVVLIRADAAVLLLGVAVLATPRIRRTLIAITVPAAIAGAVVPTLLHSQQTFARHWGELGTSPVDAVLHPWRVAVVLGSAGTMQTLLIWLLPVGFLTLGRLRWTLALVVAGAPILLASNVAMSMPWFHHAAALTPFAIGGALATIARPPGRSPLTRYAPHLLVAGVLVALAVASPLSPDAPRSARLAVIVSPRDVPGTAEALDRVGPDEAVSADGWILALLAQRQHAYQFPCPLRSIDDVRCAAPDRRPAADVVVTTVDHRAALEAAGWQVEVMPGGELIVARPS